MPYIVKDGKLIKVTKCNSSSIDPETFKQTPKQKEVMERLTKKGLDIDEEGMYTVQLGVIGKDFTINYGTPYERTIHYKEDTFIKALDKIKDEVILGEVRLHPTRSETNIMNVSHMIKDIHIEPSKDKGYDVLGKIKPVGIGELYIDEIISRANLNFALRAYGIIRNITDDGVQEIDIERIISWDLIGG